CYQRVGLPFQRRVVEPDGASNQEQGGQRCPHQLAGGDVGQEVGALISRHALARIFANRLAAGGQRVAVNDDLVVVNEEEDGQQEWQQEDVQQIEAQQTTCANHRSAAQEQVDIGADDLRPWCCLRGANGHGHSPIGQLVPGQQVAAKA